MAKLVGKKGLFQGTVLAFEGAEEWTIGRDPERAQLVVADPSCSRAHAVVRLTDDGYTIENLSSINPLLVNSEEIPEPHLLSEGDEVQVGDTTFAYTTAEEEPYETLFEVPAPPEADLTPTSRWLIKVVAGPNTGAEFALQTDRSYLIGTDAATCDVVFHDLSVSRQHARLTVGKDETLTIEDLHSRNGVQIAGQSISEPTPLKGNDLVSTGTTNFVIIDREEALKTIISAPPPVEEGAEIPPTFVEEEKPKEKPILSGGAFILLLAAIAILVIAVAGTLSLFKTDEVTVETRDFKAELIQATESYPGVRYSFNRATGKLFLLGHVITPVEKNELLYNLQNLKFIGTIEDNVVVDQYVWEEYNSLLSTTPAWRGVNIHAPTPGHFVISGYVQTQKQATELEDYLRVNFPYLDILSNEITVEDLLNEDIRAKLTSTGFPQVNIDLANGEVTLTGYIGKEDAPRFDRIVDQIKTLHGVRLIRNYVVLLAVDTSIVDLTGKYRVEGATTTDGKTVNVLIDDQIVGRGDLFDGMEVISITRNTIILEKNNVKYKIQYNQ